jgi:1-acyl-sn-glycerol-3-phosphate acyltransferase
MTFYRFCQRMVRAVWPLIGKLEVQGRELIPAQGPFLLLANHQSVLDPILIQTVCPRPIHTMAKSTQFASPIIAQLMYRLNSFPVRRYRIDPQAVRYALSILRRGEPVGIYIEGERSWDARLQTPRLGTIRLALKAGVPVIPCTIQGSYDVWPRWHRALRRAPIRITFGEPIQLPMLERRTAREAALPATATLLMERLAAQLGADHAPEVAGSLADNQDRVAAEYIAPRQKGR